MTNKEKITFLEKCNYVFNLKRMSHVETPNSLYPQNSVQGLYKMVKKYFNEDFVVAEVGSFEGASTLLFALFAKQVHSIDPYLTGSAEEQASGIFDDFNLKAEQTFVDRCKSYSYNNIIKIRKTSMEACPDFATGSLDCVYIDGEHNYEHINNDITNWYPKLKKGGILSGHDYDPHHSATIHSVLTRLNLLNDTFTTYPDTSWSVIIQ